MHLFDQAIALAPLAEGRWQGRTSPEYANLVGPYGGILSACLMNAVLSDPRAAGDPVSITVNFCAAVPEGGYEIATRQIRAGKYLQHWSVELVSGGQICTTASIILAHRGADYSHQPVTAPVVPPAGECDLLDMAPMPMGWLHRYDFRFVEGPPPLSGLPTGGQGPARSVNWVADKPARPLDHLSLTSLSDSFLLRLFHVRGTLVPMGTVSMTTHFIATCEEIVEQGTAPVLGVADAIRFHGNFHDQHMQLWSASGKLLASGTQVVWFKQ
ncbi:MAG: thioesterase family protein [Rhodobacteraceae bacterium]|nr:thioesterase family protein [Paracoccaceae bacterium]